ncbi:UPF0481 protein At3g47200-like [Cornus florida]|uniref:UPF0481 protein At3g47200-like n=1 Tax=Cornus florida TaxID=4283 RepID=UPI0028A0C223|nr:UPF0481 protein At3g47200-like [Cornus florida]
MERTDTGNHGIPSEISIKELMENLPPMSPECCIYRVPKRLRVLKEKTYTPQAVSIGPFHRGKENLQAMEEHKLRYLQSFLNRVGMSLDRCMGETKKWEQRARDYYAERIELSSDKFVEMLLLDGSFIIEILWRYNFSMLNEPSDYLNRPHMIIAVRTDLILLENQLPFFVLENLFNLIHNSDSKPQHSFLRLSIKYFKNITLISNTQQSISTLAEAKHVLDLLRICHLPSSTRSQPIGGVKFVTIRNATELKEAGMKFNSGSSKHLLDIQYTMGSLEIPHFSINDSTESLLRNLIALEHCHYTLDSYIMDYVFFMDNLIDTVKDADLLIQRGIIQNLLGDSSEVAGLFNNLTSEMLWWSENYYFHDTCEKLNAYCKVTRHKWKAKLEHDYFSTPWRTASTVAAFILLVLSFIQTICSIISP